MLTTHRSQTGRSWALSVSATLAAAVAVALCPLHSHAVAAGVSGPRSSAPTERARTVSTARMAVAVSTQKASAAAEYRGDVVAWTNKKRKQHHLKSLKVTSCLQGFASPWAAHMASHKSMTHQNLGPFLSHCHKYYAEENIAAGSGMSAHDVVAAWLASPEHRRNLYSKKVKHVAIGAVQSGSTWWVVQDFTD